MIKKKLIKKIKKSQKKLNSFIILYDALNYKTLKISKKIDKLIFKYMLLISKNKNSGA